MRTIVSLLSAAAALAFIAAAEGAETNAPAVAAQPVPAEADKAPKRTGMTPEDRVEYAALTKTELEFSVALRILTELAEEHFKRADEAAPEKAQWETDLAQELRNKGSGVQGQLHEATRQRMAFERDHAPAPPPALGVLEENKPLKPDEFAYISKLDERLLKTRQELAALEDAASSLHSELRTNHTEEATWRISAVFKENAERARELEKELSHLELKKLEFRAIRK